MRCVSWLFECWFSRLINWPQVVLYWQVPRERDGGWPPFVHLGTYSTNLAQTLTVPFCTWLLPAPFLLIDGFIFCQFPHPRKKPTAWWLIMWYQIFMFPRGEGATTPTRAAGDRSAARASRYNSWNMNWNRNQWDSVTPQRHKCHFELCHWKGLVFISNRKRLDWQRLMSAGWEALLPRCRCAHISLLLCE